MQIAEQQRETRQLEHDLITGDVNAFEMIFKSYYPVLCNYAYTYLKDKEEAEEIVQNVFLNVWEKRSQISIQSSLKSYLYQTVRNTCLNVIKHEKVKRKHQEETLAIKDRAYEAVSDRVIGKELEEKIALAIQSLPEQCRIVFTMSRFEELKYAEIASELNISVKTVENQIGKALKIMREQLKEYLPLVLIFFQFLML